MPRNVFYTSLVAIIVSSFAVCNVSHGAKPSDTLLPATTTGYLSVPDVALMNSRWNETELGHLAADPVMQPFTEDLKKQMSTALLDSGLGFGLSWDDVFEAINGEACLALVQPNHDPSLHASIILADVTGRLFKANALLKRIAKSLTDDGAKQRPIVIDGIPLLAYDIPPKKGAENGSQAFMGIAENQLFIVDDEAEMRGLLKRFSGDADDSLAKTPAFIESLKLCADDAAQEPAHIRWFVTPFQYAQAKRAMNGGRRSRGPDMLKILINQGFDAVQAIAGRVWFSQDNHEILHRSFVYAPAENDKNGKPLAEKYRLAARMLNLPNTKELEVQPWVPRDVATHATFNWKIREAFEYASTLVNEIADDDVFEDVLRSLEDDANGPQINVRKDLVAHFGERGTLIRDYIIPITPQSERIITAVVLTNPAAVADTIDRAMETDPNAHKRIFRDHIIWEIVDEESDNDGILAAPKIDGPGFDPFGDDEDEEDADQPDPLFPKKALTVAHGHLIFSSHIGFIRDMLDDVAAKDTLRKSHDYQTIGEALEKLGALATSVRQFERLDDSVRPTYELLRAGKMPESQSLFGKLLNQAFAGDDAESVREQKLDGSKLPDYQVVRRYLGASGLFVTSQEEGWLIVGCVLPKEKP